MLKVKLLEYLKAYERDGKRLSVSWNGGGDECIIIFYLNDEAIPYYEDEVYRAFERYLIETFDIPGVGEYYNEGGGALSIESGDKILFEYDEFAYGEYYDENVQTSIKADGFSIPSNELSRRLLAHSGKLVLDFFGSTSFLPKQHGRLMVSSRPAMGHLKKEEIEELHELIRRPALEKFKPPFEGTDIHYSGKIIEKWIVVEHLNQLRFLVDKNKVKEKMYLFE